MKIHYWEEEHVFLQESLLVVRSRGNNRNKESYNEIKKKKKNFKMTVIRGHLAFEK